MSVICIEDNEDDSWTTLPLTLNKEQNFIFQQSIERGQEYENGLRKYEELSSAIRNKVNDELGLIEDKYQNLNKKIQECIEYKAKLEKKEAELREVDEKLSMEFTLFEKWRTECKELYKDDYSKKLEEMNNSENKLKKSYDKLCNCEQVLIANINLYKEKIAAMISERSIKMLNRRTKAKDRKMIQFKLEFQNELTELTQKIDNARSVGKGLDKERKELIEKSHKIKAKDKEVTEEIAKIIELIDKCNTQHETLIKDYDTIKTKPFSTYGKNKVNLIKEQELLLTGDKIEQCFIELKAKSEQTKSKAKELEKSNRELVNREQALKIRVQKIEIAKNRLKKLKEVIDKRKGEVLIREANIKERESKVEQLQIEALGIEITKQALKRKQELQKASIAKGKDSLKIRENMLKQKEKHLGMYECKPYSIINANTKLHY